jgi:hypothetical protein
VANAKFPKMRNLHSGYAAASQFQGEKNPQPHTCQHMGQEHQIGSVNPCYIQWKDLTLDAIISLALPIRSVPYPTFKAQFKHQ